MQDKTEKIQIQKMTTEHTNITEAIAQVLTEAERLTVQAMALSRTDNSKGTQKAGPK